MDVAVSLAQAWAKNRIKHKQNKDGSYYWLIALLVMFVCAWLFTAIYKSEDKLPITVGKIEEVVKEIVEEV